MKENELIRALTKNVVRSSAQKNACFECDAELFELDGVQMGISTDEFSPEEDHFVSFAPGTLGYNLVIATVSDLWAAGVQPRFFVHACTMPRSAQDGFLEGLAQGIGEGLKDSGCYLLGGDTGLADSWRYVGTALGTVVRPLRRTGASPGARLYSTGRFGSGNRQALLKHLIETKQVADTPENLAAATPRFSSRRSAAEILWKHAAFAMDSSDGYVETLRTLAELNPACRFSVALESRLLDPVSAAVAQKAGLPPELLFFGSGGEYELLFGVPEDAAASLEAQMRAASLELHPIGRVEEGTGLQLLWGDGRRVSLDRAMPDPRALGVERYIQQLIRMLADLRG
ncbi:MAG: hypothetical protein HY901_22070 [Deltaproteobacteria bacterium]|nr:hypothetical protein [Deltaproteobacteria bacterium]